MITRMVTEGKKIDMPVRVPRCLKRRKCTVITCMDTEGKAIDTLVREIKEDVSIAANLTIFKEIVGLTTSSYVAIVNVLVIRAAYVNSTVHRTLAKKHLPLLK